MGEAPPTRNVLCDRQRPKGPLLPLDLPAGSFGLAARNVVPNGYLYPKFKSAIF